MFDFLGYFETHSFQATALVCTMILVGILIYREVSRLFNTHETRLLVLGDTAKAVEQLKHEVEQQVDKLKGLCDGSSCENFERTSEVVQGLQIATTKMSHDFQGLQETALKMFHEFQELQETVLRFERDAREARSITADGIKTIDRNINSFISDLGREILRFMREGKHDRNGS